MNFNYKQAFADLQQKAKENKTTATLLGILLFFLILFSCSFLFIRFGGNQTRAEQQVIPPMNISAPVSTQEIQQVTVIPTQIPSAEWKVKNIVGEQNINGYNSLVIDFENTTTKEVVQGQCQSRHDPSPLVGDTYTLVDTGYKDKNGQEIILFTPHLVSIKQKDGTYIRVEVGVESNFQRFSPIQ